MESAHFTATQTAQKIADAGSTARTDKVKVHNTDAANAVYLGGSDVTSSNGYTLAKGAEELFDLTNDDELWAVCAAGLTATVEVIYNYVDHE